MTDELIGVPDSLIKQRWEAEREARGAFTSHDLTRVGNVLLLILDIKGLAIPATWEHQLKTDTINTIGIEISLVWHEVAIKGAFRSLLVVEAVETDSSLLKEILSVIWCHIPERLFNIGYGVREVAIIGIASNHMEVGREGGQGGVACIWIEKIVP